MSEWESLWWFSLLTATLRLSAPLIFAALGGYLSEKSGVINLALESFLLVGAFSAASIAFVSSSAWLGWIAAFVFGCAFAALYAFCVIEGRTDQVVAGTAFNLLAIGFIPYLSKIFFDSTGSTPSLPLEDRFSFEPLLWLLMVLALVLFISRKTRAGLWLIVAGEHPEALRSSGLSPRQVRWIAVTLGGGLAAWGGATLSLALASSYSPLMSAGRGFMALAALIFGRWKPGLTVMACLLFGLTDAMQIRLQGTSIGSFTIPVQFIQILPYVVTLLALGGFMGASRAPKELGKILPDSKR